MVSNQLVRVTWSLVFRIDRIILDLDAPLPTNPTDRETCEANHRHSRKYLVVRLQQLWGDLCREIVLRSALGNSVTMAGATLNSAPGISNLADIQRIAKLAKTQITGPRAHWHYPSFSVGVASILNPANYTNISLGIGSANVDDLVAVRNYIVHPDMKTRIKYARTAWNLGFPDMVPESLIAQPVIGGATIFETWAQQLRLAAINAIS